MRRILNFKLFCCALLVTVTLYGIFNGLNVKAKPIEQRVFDTAELFSDQEAAQLETAIAEVKADKEVDIVILTIDNADGKSAQTYADDFYDNGGFGFGGVEGPGILYLIDMDNRRMEISTAGTASTYFTDDRIETMLDKIYNDVSDGNYYDSGKTFIKYVGLIMNLPPGEKIPNQPMTWVHILLCLVAALIIGTIIVLIMLLPSLRGGKVTVSGNNYFVNSSANIKNRQDIFVNKTVTRRHIERPKNNGGGGGGGFSSTRTGSSGRSHGGGGRSF